MTEGRILRQVTFSSKNPQFSHVGTSALNIKAFATSLGCYGTGLGISQDLEDGKNAACRILDETCCFSSGVLVNTVNGFCAVHFPGHFFGGL